MNSQEPNKYVRLKRARITKAVALTRKSVCPRATGLYLAQIQSRVKINEKIIHGETRSHFISFSSSKGPHTQKNSLRGSLSFLSLSLSLSLSLAISDILLLSFSGVIITSATLPFVLFVFVVVLWVSRRFSSPRISGRRKVSLSSLRPVWTEAAEAFRL